MIIKIKILSRVHYKRNIALQLVCGGRKYPPFFKETKYFPPNYHQTRKKNFACVKPSLWFFCERNWVRFLPLENMKKISLSLCFSWLEEVMHEGCIRKMGFILQMFCIIMVRKAWENASFPWRASLLCVEDKLAIYLLIKVYK